MKLLFFIAFFALVAVCWTSPLEEEKLKSEQLLHQDGGVLHRAKRATCPWFPSACEVHCRTKGFSTGFCRGGTCTCKNY